MVPQEGPQGLETLIPLNSHVDLKYFMGGGAEALGSHQSHLGCANARPACGVLLPSPG